MVLRATLIPRPRKRGTVTTLLSARRAQPRAQFLVLSLGMLVAAGLSPGAGAQRAPAAPAPPACEPVTVAAEAPVATTFFRALLPLSLDVSKQLPTGTAETHATVVDVRYVAGVDAHHARLRAIALPGPAPKELPALLQDGDEKAALDEIARRAAAHAGSAAWVGALDLTVEALPWQAAFSIDGAAVQAPDSAPAATGIDEALRGLPQPAAQSRLSNVAFPVGDDKKMSVDVSLAFAGQQVILTAVHAGDHAASPAAQGPALFTGTPAPGVTVRIPFSFARETIRRYYGGNPFAVFGLLARPVAQYAPVSVTFDGRTYLVDVGITRARVDASAAYVGGEVHVQRAPPPAPPAAAPQAPGRQ